MYEIYLSYRDFGCTPDDYIFDLEITRRQERNGEEICQWFEDTDGRRIVAGLSLNSAYRRIEITDSGFAHIGAMQKIFISYAKEDSDTARRLYNKLREDGFDAWLDEETLRPGQKWEVHIEDAITKCDFFIALLSRQSVAKRGYVQKEIRSALDALETVPERAIFLIPVRLDNCKPSHPILEELHRVDMFPEDNWYKAYDKIRSVLLGENA